MAKALFLIFMVSQICSEQSADNIFPAVKDNVTREISEGITNNPVVSITTNVYSNAFAAVVNSVSWAPYTVAKSLGTTPLQILAINGNDVDVLIDQFTKDFNQGSENEDATLKIDALITKYGFPVEIHEVETEDGYLLTMYRIPSNGSVVFLMHGLLGSADDYVVAGRDSGLAYLLADAGYDVWLGNARGNKHSRRHTTLDPSEGYFWDFSWHEIGIYDLPAMIDSVLNETNKKSLKYIGHSQGTTSFFVMTSEIPEYNKKISLMIALSPVAFMANARSPIIRLATPGSSIINGFSKGLGLYEFLPDNNLVRSLKLLLCGTGFLAELLCSNTLFLISGYDIPQLNVTNLSVIFGHIPSGASIKQLTHYGHGHSGGDFRQFDYGREGNLRRYGGELPPEYVLENVVAPVSLFFSEEDWLADPTDVDKLYKRLTNVVDYYKIPYKQFNHLDFVFAKDVKELIYKRLLKVLSSF